ncbi:fasciculation and elongation protein zeta-1 isoform X2 [Thunnus albacares]|uniref:fasciculation and elongation protein zeta-1 isoform X2 n=1 Tax=Thunnus albacares TaxID=8236 RepID=UPI001CF64D3D|nr:fasciculation and elongation protein zeta-1 isoform X2 [Thunnus albacares]
MEKPGPAGDDTFESMEEFQMVLNELVGDKSMDQIRVEYEKLIHALKKSRENERRLMSKCRELNAEIVSTSTKVSAALKLSQEDETTITSLKRELDKAWKMVDAAHDKEKKDKETIGNLKEEVANLTKMAEQQTGLYMDQRQSDLLKMNEEVTKERDQLLTTVESLREKLNKVIATQQEVEAQKESALENISQLQQELQVQQNEISREMRLKEKLDKEVKQLHVNMETKMGDIKALNLQGQRAKEEQQRLEQQLKELKILNERATKELEQMQVKNTKLQQECEQLSSVKEHLSLENQQNTNELKMREEEVNQMRQEISKQTKMREAIQKKFHQMEDQKADVDVQKETLKAQIVGLEKDLESSQKQVEADKKTIDELIRERDILNKNTIKAAQSTEKQQNLVKLLEQDKKTLEHETSGYRQEAQKQRKIIQQLEKERDRYINETSNLMQKVQQKMNDVEVKEMEIFDWRKKVTEAECKLKQQENLLESVVSERNLYSKNLIEAQEEIAEMKRKMKTMNNQVTRLRDEITGKELALAKDQQEHKRLEKDNETLKGELQMIKLQLEETKQRIDSQKAEQQKLQKIIADGDDEQIRQRKQLEQVIRERDNLGKQLLHRNDERALLYEKIRIQQSILSKGDFHYNQRMEDIHLLKLEIKRLRRKKNILDKTVPNTQDLRRELFHLQRELLRERTRNSVLEEQLKPINIHRWRRLEGSDPSKYELIQKIQSLQKRLIAKTQELEERELLLQEKEKLYVELKHILARQPGPEAAEQLQHCQWTIRERTKKLKALIAELRVVDSKMNEYKSENQRLANELANIKKKYLSQKKLHSEQKTKVEQLEPLPQLSSKPHFTGGGFRIDNPQLLIRGFCSGGRLRHRFSLSKQVLSTHQAITSAARLLQGSEIHLTGDSMEAPLVCLDEEFEDLRPCRMDELDHPALNHSSYSTTSTVPLASITREDFSELENFSEMMSFKSMEDLVNEFDEKLNVCFHNYNTKTEGLAPIRSQSHNQEDEERLQDEDVWDALTDNYICTWDSPDSEGLNGNLSEQEIHEKEEEEMNEKNDNANCLSEEPLITADQVIEEIVEMMENSPDPGETEEEDEEESSHCSPRTNPSLLEEIRQLSQASNNNCSYEGLSLMPSSALVELLHRVEAAIREYSEELVSQLARRDELEFEKEVKNTFITALMEVQNRQKEQRDSSKRRRRDKALSLQGPGTVATVNAGNTGSTVRTEKTGTMPAKRFSMEGLSNILQTGIRQTFGSTGNDKQYLNTVIPFEKKGTPPSVDDLQMLTKILFAMKEDSEKVPTLLTDYILKVLCPT